ncbi:MAG: hypothetical protein RLZZ546_2974, partial [Bacteroidota bacterium]
MIYPAKNIKNTLFIDIETVSEYRNFSDLSDVFKKLWTKKASALDKSADLTIEENANLLYRAKAGIFSEFSKIVCISSGYIAPNGKLRIKSFYDHDEKSLLINFSQLLKTHYPDTNA